MKSGILGVQVATGAVEGGGMASGSSSNSESVVSGSSSNSKSLSSVYAKASAAMLCSLSDTIMLLSYNTEWPHPLAWTANQLPITYSIPPSCKLV